nr:unnamed protein product [Callosobruchus chinensis]
MFLRRLADLAVKVGTRTRFLVEIRTATDVQIEWYKNEERVEEGERYRFVNEGKFHCVDVVPVMAEDTGRWTCTARNLSGQSSSSCHLNVLIPKTYKAPEFLSEVRAVLTEQGTVSLECKVAGVPTPLLRWFRDGEEVRPGDVVALTAHPDHLGVYSVHIPTGPPPNFVRDLKDESIKIGDPILLSCQVSVPPWPKSIHWYNSEGRIEDGQPRYKEMADGIGGYMLEVKPTEACDQGEWKCVATSNEGAPRFMDTLKAVLTEEGLVSFECKVVGSPTPLLRWFKDGQELKPGDVYQLTGTNSLGSYCCIARNCMGEARSSAELTVEDIQNQLSDEERAQLVSRSQAPKFLHGLNSAEAKINEPYRFTVQVSVTTPLPSLTWFRDDHPVAAEPEKYLVYRENLGVCHLDVRLLELNDQAEWKCVATNEFGHSVTSCFLKLVVPKHFKKPKCS